MQNKLVFFIAFILISTFSINFSEESLKHLIFMELNKDDKELDMQTLPGELLLERVNYLIIRVDEEQISEVSDLGNRFELIDSSQYDPNYLLVFNPKKLGIEPLRDYGEVIFYLQDTSEYILKSPIDCSGFLSQMGYSAYVMKPIITIIQEYEIEDPEYSQSINDVLNRLSIETNSKFLSHLENFPTRYSYSPYIEDSQNYVSNICQNWGYDVEYQEYEKYSPLHIQDIYFLPDGSHGWIPTRNGYLFRTDDLCYNFNYTQTNIIATDAYFHDVNKGWLTSLNGLVALTDDGGKTWIEIDTNNPNSNIWDIDFLNETTGFICGDDGLLLKTTDGGYTWERINLETDVTFEEIYFVTNQISYIAGHSSTIYKTTDGWNSWELLNIIQETDFKDICFINENEGWVCGISTGYILHTNDGGQNWEEQKSHPRGMMSVDFWNSNIGWAANDIDYVFHTTDGGENWESIPTLTSAKFSCILSLDENSAIVAGFGGAYITRNGGDTWEISNFSGLNEIPWRNVIVTKEGDNKPEEIVIAIAHLDCISEIPLERAPGADDNGSGSIALLSMAKALKNISTNRTIKFLFVSGEEQGLHGSDAYATWARQNDLNIIGVLNMDMIGYLDEDILDLQIRSNDSSFWLYDYSNLINKMYNIGLIIYSGDSGGGSDHIPFWQNGYSAVCSIEYPGDHWYPYYHSSQDLMQYLSMDYQTKVTKLNLAVLLSLAELKGFDDIAGEVVPFTYPNPYQPSLQVSGITFTNLEGYDTLKIYSLSGKKLFEHTITGNLSYIWDCTNSSDEQVSSGVYLWILEGDSGDFSGKIAIIR